MEIKLNSSKNQENNNNQNNEIINSKINFITNHCEDKFQIENNNEKVCEYCKSSFFSKFNKDRHFNTIHLKVNINQNLISNKNNKNIQNNKEKGNETENNKTQEKINSNFIGYKRKSVIYLNDIKEENNQQKITFINKENNVENILINENNNIITYNNNLLDKKMQIFQFIQIIMKIMKV